MNREERVRIGEAWLALAQMYGREIPRAALSFMLDAVADLPSDQVLAALNQWGKTSKLNRHPLPAEVRELVCPGENISAESQAREIAARISGAIPKFGWCNPDQAQEFIGPIGWQIVQCQGGWRYLCENHGLTIDPTSFQAQVRDQLTANLKYGPALEAKIIELPTRNSGLVQIGQILKSLNPSDPNKGSYP